MGFGTVYANETVKIVTEIEFGIMRQPKKNIAKFDTVELGPQTTKPQSFKIFKRV